MSAPVTTPARRRPPARPFPLRAGVAEVLAVAPLTPRMTRIVFTAPSLADFPVEESGEIVTLIWPVPGHDLVLPSSGWRFPAGTPEQHARNFTVRSHDPSGRMLAVDFFLHGDRGEASRWASAAHPGDRIGYAGPRTHWRAADDGAAWTLLVADETGLPALTAIAERLPSFHRIIACIEVSDADERQPIHTSAKLDVHWIHREGAAPGETLALADAVRALPLPDGRGRVWGAGESGVMRVIRDHLRDEREIPRASLQLLGYWKHDATEEWMG